MKSAFVLALVMVLTACADASTTETTPAADTTAPADTTTSPTDPPDTTAPIETTAPADTTTTTTAAPDEDMGVISTAETSLGTILVDEDGLTLYILATDGSESTCYGSCASTWPVVAAGASAADDLDITLGSTTRTDGNEQLTINGQPVYLYVGDSAPGDVNGQGLFDIWFVLDASGEPIV